MMGMAWELDADRPIYAQLVERIQREIVSGQYRPGEKLPSVRDFAAVAAVNPNTMPLFVFHRLTPHLRAGPCRRDSESLHSDIPVPACC